MLKKRSMCDGEELVFVVKKYVLKIIENDKGVLSVESTIKGFSELEILEFVNKSQADIISQIRVQVSQGSC